MKSQIQLIKNVLNKKRAQSVLFNNNFSTGMSNENFLMPPPQNPSKMFFYEEKVLRKMFFNFFLCFLSMECFFHQFENNSLQQIVALLQWMDNSNGKEKMYNPTNTTIATATTTTTTTTTSTTSIIKNSLYKYIY
jgi:hypothetical protein